MQLTLSLDPSMRSASLVELHSLAAYDVYNPLVLDFNRYSTDEFLRVHTDSLSLELARTEQDATPLATCVSFAPVANHPRLFTATLGLTGEGFSQWFNDLSSAETIDVHQTCYLRVTDGSGSPLVSQACPIVLLPGTPEGDTGYATRSYVDARVAALVSGEVARNYAAIAEVSSALNSTSSSLSADISGLTSSLTFNTSVISGIISGLVERPVLLDEPLEDEPVSADRIAFVTSTGQLVPSPLPSGVLVPGHFTSGSVTASALASGSVTASALASGSVTASALASGCIAAGALGSGVVTPSAFAGESVETSAIKDHAVTAAKLASGSVIAGKLASGAVTGSALSDGAVTSDKLGSGSVTAAKLASGSVTSSALSAGAVTSDKLGSGSVTAAKLASGSVTSSALSDGAVTSGKLASGAVTSSALSSGAVTSAHLAPDAVTSVHASSANIYIDTYQEDQLHTRGAFLEFFGADHTPLSARTMSGKIAAAVDDLGQVDRSYDGALNHMAIGITAVNGHMALTAYRNSADSCRANLSFATRDHMYFTAGQADDYYNDYNCGRTGWGITVEAMYLGPANLTQGIFDDETWDLVDQRGSTEGYLNTRVSLSDVIRFLAANLLRGCPVPANISDAPGSVVRRLNNLSNTISGLSSSLSDITNLVSGLSSTVSGLSSTVSGLSSALTEHLSAGDAT